MRRLLAGWRTYFRRSHLLPPRPYLFTSNQAGAARDQRPTPLPPPHSASPPHPALPEHTPPCKQVLPKEQRPAAQRIKKRAAGVSDRLTALGAALRALGTHVSGVAAPKLCKALDGLARAKVGGWLGGWLGLRCG